MPTDPFEIFAAEQLKKGMNPSGMMERFRMAILRASQGDWEYHNGLWGQPLVCPIDGHSTCGHRAGKILPSEYRKREKERAGRKQQQP